MVRIDRENRIEVWLGVKKKERNFSLLSVFVRSGGKVYITFRPEVRRLRIDNHLVEQIIGIGILVDDKEYVPYVGDY